MISTLLGCATAFSVWSMLCYLRTDALVREFGGSDFEKQHIEKYLRRWSTATRFFLIAFVISLFV